MQYFETAVFKPSFQQVFEQESSEIANVGVAVHCGAAGVHSHFARFNRSEIFLSACQCVEKTNFAWRKRHFESLSREDLRLFKPLTAKWFKWRFIFLVSAIFCGGRTANVLYVYHTYRCTEVNIM